MGLKARKPRLKPCPFCGAEPTMLVDGHGTVIIHCSDCVIPYTAGPTRATVRAWNRRAQEPR